MRSHESSSYFLKKPAKVCCLLFFSFKDGADWGNDLADLLGAVFSASFVASFDLGLAADAASDLRFVFGGPSSMSVSLAELARAFAFGAVVFSRDLTSSRDFLAVARDGCESPSVSTPSSASSDADSSVQ